MKGEVIGGGWLVLERFKTTGRLVGIPGYEFANAADAVEAAQRLAESFPGNAFCVLTQRLEIIIQDSAAPADTAAGGSGFSPDEAAASTPKPQLAAAAGEGK